LIFNKLEKQLLKSALNRLILVHRLSPLNDSLITIITKRQYLAHWKDVALEDRRITKLMYRAGKYHARTLRAKYFNRLKSLVVPKYEIMPCRVTQLLKLAFSAFKRYRM
jgi:hypothetical protein